MNKEDTVRQKQSSFCSERESWVQAPRPRARAQYALHPDGALPRSLGALRHCCGLNICFPPELTCWTPYAQWSWEVGPLGGDYFMREKL